MIDFRLDEEQTMLSQTISRFAREQMRPAYRDADEDGLLPPGLLQAGWELGLVPAGIPEAYGGLGEHSAVTGAVALEAFAWGDLAAALAILSPNLVAVPLIEAGSASQKEQFLPRFSGREMPRFTAALSEPRVQFDPRRLAATATRQGEGYLLQGAKSMVPLAAEAEWFLVYAAEEGQTQAFLLPAETPGLTVGQREKLMGLRALPTYTLALDGCRVPASARLGEDAGIEFDRLLNRGRIALAAAAVGLARAAWEYATDYAKNRVQFGEPIAHRQSIAFMLAEMAIDIDAARLMVWETAWKLDQGQPATAEATLMKFTADDMVLRVADQALQVLGGHGYIREHPVELWLRNARGFAAFDGLAII